MAAQWNKIFGYGQEGWARANRHWNLMQVAALINLYQIIKSSDCFIKQPTKLVYRFNTFQCLSDNDEIQMCLLDRTTKWLNIELKPVITI